METELTYQPCDELESMLGDLSPKKRAGRGFYNCHDTEDKWYEELGM
jgi:hypothetical protein